ncbi:MAG TPA: hypothetical protein VNF71_16590 [Acidimicrobiales bacterium]|nr:hypothetical protein [Acidimicrobiales bacterium]
MITRFRLLIAAVLASAGVLLASAPARAVQTTTWGLVAAPAGQHQRTSLSHPADGSTVHDAVIVYNRTARPVTVHLYVLGTNYVNGGYQFSRPDTGLAAGTSLGTHTVNLGPYQKVRVPVTIHMPHGIKSAALAGIGAEASAVNDGDLSIVQQLVVLVKANPSSHVVAPLAKDLFPWALIAIGILVVVAVLVERERRRARRFKGPLAAPVVA